MSDDEDYLVMQPDEDLDSIDDDYCPWNYKEDDSEKKVSIPQAQGKIMAAPNPIFDFNFKQLNNIKDQPSLEIKRMIEVKKKKEFENNTKTIISISSLRVDLKKKDLMVAKMKADLEKKNGEMQVLMEENKIIPKMKQDNIDLKSQNDSLKLQNNSLKCNIETLKKMQLNNNTSTKKISVLSRLGGRGDMSRRLGCVRRVNSEERGTQRICNVEGEVKEKLKISRLIKQQEEEEERELENEYLDLRYKDDEKFEPFGNKDQEFEPLPDDLVLTEITDNGPKPAKRKRISAP